jgi:hypothetical protein
MRLPGVTACATAVMLSASAPARAQIAGPAPAEAAQDSAYAPRYRWSPVFTNKINSSVSSVDMSNDLTAGLLTPWGSFFSFSLADEEKNYRLQDRFEQTRRLRLSDLHTFNLFWNGAATFSDSRVFNRSIALGGGVQDFIINDQLMSLNGTYKRKHRDVAIGDLRTDAMGTLGAINSERTFKDDRGIQAGMNGGIAYDIGDRITWQGRGALRGAWEQSSTVDTTFTGLGSSEDSLMTAIGFQAADSIRFDVSHRRYNGDRDFTDQGRGSLGSQLGGAENVFKETEMRDTRNTTLTLNSRIFTRLSLSMTASHDEQVFDYAVQQTRYSRTVSDGVSGSIAYKLPWRTTTSLQFENSETLRDLGPQSISSLTDKRKRVALFASHQFSKTFSMDFNGSSAIQQSFYLKYEENPRDRDQVDTSLNLRITSLPFRRFSTTIALAYSVTDVVNIDATQSEDNRTRELWDFRPSFTYRVIPGLTIVQVYGLSFEYTDYDYKETQNYLDRNITFSNEFQFRPISNVDTRFEYALALHDKGSYLPDEVTGERVLDVANEDRRDRTRIRVDYRATKNIKFFAENQYSNWENRITGSDVVDTTTEGQIIVGTTADYDWGGGRKLRMLLSRVKRFSPLGVDAEKNYWDARSEFVYPF